MCENDAPIIDVTSKSLTMSYLTVPQFDAAYWSIIVCGVIPVVFLLIGICGYFTVPTVASWIVQAGGFNSYNNLVTQGGKWLGGFAMGSITGAGKYIKGQGKRIAEEERKFKMRHPNIK